MTAWIKRLVAAVRRQVRLSRTWMVVAVVSSIAAAIGWTGMGYGLWVLVVASAALLAAVVAVEETRVAEAHREADSWRARTCRHGASSFAPYDGDEVER